jgi:hypothetical protein
VPVLLDKQGNRFPYETMTENSESLVLDENRIFAGRLSDYQIEGVAVVVDRCVTRLAFRKRFTQGEKIAIELAALDDPAAPQEQRTRAAALRVDMKDTDAATYIDLDRQDTREGVLALELLGLLDEGRALEILDAEIQPLERPQ